MIVIALDVIRCISHIRRLLEGRIKTPKEYFFFCGWIASVFKHCLFYRVGWNASEKLKKAITLFDYFWRQISVPRTRTV